MVRTAGFTAAVALLGVLVAGGPAGAQAKIGCFRDGDFVYLHVGSAYQYFLDLGHDPVDCTPEAVHLGLEIAEEAVATTCASPPGILCEEKKRQAALIRQTYPDLLAQDVGELTDVAPDAEAAGAAAATAGAVESRVIRGASRDAIRWVQSSLHKLGYDPGKVDGAMGRRTAAAIRQYESDNGMPVTGKLTTGLIQSLKQKTAQP